MKEIFYQPEAGIPGTSQHQIQRPRSVRGPGRSCDKAELAEGWAQFRQLQRMARRTGMLVPQSFAAKLLGMDSPRLHRLIQARLLQTIELERRRFVGSDSLETLARSERLHRRGVNKPWTANEESLLGTASDRDIALKIGRSIKIVRARRCELGVPSFRWKRHLEWIEHGSVKRLN